MQNLIEFTSYFFVAWCKSEDALTNYLQVLASLSSTIVMVEQNVSEQQQADNDSDNESDGNVTDQEQADILRKCIEMLNEQQRVNCILSTIEHSQSDSAALLQPLCRLCHHLLITNKLAVHKYKLLYMLAFKPMFLKHLWTNLTLVRQTSLFGGSGAASTPLLQIISRGIALSAEDTDRIVPLLAVFCSLFSLLIATLHDTEFFLEENNSAEQTFNNRQQHAMPFTIAELAVLSGHLKGVCLGLVELAFPDTRPTVRDDYKNAVLGPTSTVQCQHDTQIWTHLFKVSHNLKLLKRYDHNLI